MKHIAWAGFLIVMWTKASVLQAQDASVLPGPQKEHEWLQQLVGEWDSEAEFSLGPGQPLQKSPGTESVRSIGKFWVVAEGKGTFMTTPVSSVLTLGYDPQKKKYVGTWIDSMFNYLWKYEGTVDTAGKVLTLETEGPCPAAPGELCKFKEVLELKGKDHKVFTSSMQQEEGNWMTIVTVSYRRKK